MKSVWRILSQIMIVALVVAGLASTHAFQHAATASSALASNEMSANCNCPPDAGCNPDACSHAGDCAAMCASHAIAAMLPMPAFQTSTIAMSFGAMAAYSSAHYRPLLPPPTV